MLLKAEVSKVDYSSKAKSCNVRDLLVAKNTVHTCVYAAVSVTCVYTVDLLRHDQSYPVLEYLECYLATPQNVDATLSF